MKVTHLIEKRVLELGRSRFMLTSRMLKKDFFEMLFGRLVPGTVNPVVMDVALSIPNTVFTRTALDFLKLNIPIPLTD